MKKFYLNSYHPVGLKYQKKFQNAWGVAPFVDASHRAEPDFQQVRTTISSICRAAVFAPKLRKGYKIAYMSVKEYGTPYLVALLLVTEEFDSHREAAEWFKSKGFPLSQNCLVEENPPNFSNPFGCGVGIDATCGRNGCGSETTCEDDEQNYQERTRNWGKFLVCENLFLDLIKPPKMTKELANRLPNTINGPDIPEGLFNELHALTIRAPSTVF